MVEPLVRTTSFVTITGPGPGIGKTTLSENLRDALEARGQPVFLVPEEWLFEWPQFAHLADMFQRRDFPSADVLLDALRAIDRLVPEGAVWVQDWSWIALGEDLPWAVDPVDLATYSNRAYQVVQSRSPVVLYATTDILVGIERASLQRGPAWLRKPATLLAEEYARREPRYVGAIEAAPWDIRVVDASASPDTVLLAALEALGVVR